MSIFDELKAPFPESKIHWRVGATTKAKDKGIALAYLDARDVMERLDEVVGPEHWQCDYPFPGCCRIGIRTEGDWVWKTNGAGETDVEGTKGQFSDAFKRAAVLWGIGRYLYDLPNVWVRLEAAGRSYKLAETPALPSWALPSGKAEKPPETPEMAQIDPYLNRFHQLIDRGDALSLYALRLHVGDDKWADYFNTFPQGRKTELKQRCRDLESEGAAQFREYVEQYSSGDDLWRQQTLDEVGKGVFGEIEKAAKEKAA